MGNFSIDPAHVRVDVFKGEGQPSKWVETAMLDMREHYNDVDLHAAVLLCWVEQQSTRTLSHNGGNEDFVISVRLRGCWLVCLEPYHINEHPIILKIQ